MSSYEDLNKKSKEDNLAVLKSFQVPLIDSLKFTPLNGSDTPEKDKYRGSAGKKTTKYQVANGSAHKKKTAFHQSPYATRRRSKHLESLLQDDLSNDSLKTDEPEESSENITPAFRENVFGEIPGVQIGDTYETRLLCSRVGVHRPTVAGIHGGKDGCYSVALSGNYEDDEDNFHTFTYTGSGGRDLKGTKANPKNLRTAPQSKDQDLNRFNMSLVLSYEKKLPVRVVRGYKLNSQYAPLEGYRYDGLYTVSKYYQDIGKSGFKVYKFVMERCPGQALPWQE